jgi:hypothetical protein
LYRRKLHAVEQGLARSRFERSVFVVVLIRLPLRIFIRVRVPILLLLAGKRTESVGVLLVIADIRGYEDVIVDDVKVVDVLERVVREVLVLVEERREPAGV